MKKILVKVMSVMLIISTFGMVGGKIAGVMAATSQNVNSMVSEQRVTPSGIVYGDLQQNINEFIEEHKEDCASVSIGVFQNEETLSFTQYGYSDIENGIEVNPDTVYEWGSVSKLFTRVSVMQLYEQGLIDLHEDIRNYEFECRAMELEVEIPETPIMCNIDAVQFKRAVQNLITNAYKHNENGTRVGIQVKNTKKNVRILVSDAGLPIDRELQENMFESFVCGNESRTSKDGSGLGLAITKRIVEKHGGRVYMNNQVQGYTKAFVIEVKRCVK